MNRARIVYDRDAPEGVALVREPAPEPGEGEVLLAVRYAALNAVDLRRRDERGPGIEVAGTVAGGVDLRRRDERGPGIEVAGTVAGGFEAGARVFGLVDRGGLSDLVLARADLLTPVPPELDDQAAAAAPEAFIVAADALEPCGDDGPVLVAGASSGVGLACVQLAVARGRRVIAAARNPAARELLTQLGAVAVDGPNGAAAAVRGIGEPGRLVDLAGGPELARYLWLLAPGGEAVLLGALAGETVPMHVPTLIGRSLTVRGATMGRRGAAARRAAVRRFAESVVPLLASGTVHPLVHAVLPVTQTAAAFAVMRRSGKTGKVLIDFQPNTRKCSHDA